VTSLIAVVALSASAQSFTPPSPLDASDTDGHDGAAFGVDLDGKPVVGGTIVSNADKWPDTAGIIMSNQWMDVECTGVLVAPDVVLTAGHCNIGIKRVILGTNNYDQGGEIIAVSHIWEYKYGTGETAVDPSNSENQPSVDMTVLKLASKAHAKPRAIASGEIADQYIVDGASVTVVGYGAHDPQGYQYDDKLREGDTEIFDADCSDLYNGCVPQISPGGELAAGGSGTADSCYGDSGGPLYLNTPDGIYLAGLTSRGPAPCGSWGSIYVRPDAVIDYIEEVTGETIGGLPPDPVAPPIYTTKNTAAITTIEPRDPDGDDGMTYAIKVAPNNGSATVDEDGTVRFQPESGFLGSDQVVVTVTDPNGMAADAIIAVKVLSHHAYKDATGNSAGGCDVSGGAGGGMLAFAAVMLLGARRRR
jgi:secreted trypsin-like serine protease